MRATRRARETGGFISVSAPVHRSSRTARWLGAKYTYDWMQLVRRPTDGLIVTLADGSPPETLKPGDTLLYQLFIEAPAVDVTVETMVDSMYSPVGDQRRAVRAVAGVGAKDGREEWAAQVTLGKGTTKADGTRELPVMFGPSSLAAARFPTA